MASNRLWEDRDGKTVILDSSAVMILFEFCIYLEDELTRLLGKFRIIVPSPIVEELKLLSEKGKGKKKLIAKPSLELIKKYEIVDEGGNGDDAVLMLAKKLNGIVITNDRELRKRVKESYMQTIYLRGKGRLVLD